MNEATECRVSPEEAGARLDLFLSRALNQSRSQVQALLKEGFVSQSSSPKPRASSYRVREGEIFLVRAKSFSAPKGVSPEEIPLDIVYEDDLLLVLNKPAGLVVHPAAGHFTGTLVHALLHHCKNALSARGGAERLGIVHRLDKETSGLMVIAKTDAAHEALSRQFHDRQVEKIYLALARGKFRSSKGECLGAIGRHPVHRQKMTVLARGGRNAHTEYRVLKQWKEAALVECKLHTGRTHQIRVHLAHLGHPIVGDLVYGRSSSAKFPTAARQLLHAFRLGFFHPKNGEWIQFEAKQPADFEQFIQQLG